MIRVRDYIMGSLFDGEPSKELIEKCDASDTGGALAWRDENGIWTTPRSNCSRNGAGYRSARECRAKVPNVMDGGGAVLAEYRGIGGGVQTPGDGFDRASKLSRFRKQF